MNETRTEKIATLAFAAMMLSGAVCLIALTAYTVLTRCHP